METFFGWFNGTDLEPIQVFEGDSVLQKGDYLHIVKDGCVVATVRLDRGQHIRKL